MSELAVAPAWVCLGCGARVPMSSDACASCGRAFGEGLDSLPVATGRRLRRWGLVLRELVVLNVLFVLWRIVGQVSLFHAAGAFARGRWLWSTERRLHLPSEATLQHAVLGHATLSRLLDGYYAYVHAAAMAAMLLWLLWRHREHYPKWRNLVVAVTGGSLLLGLLPVAPPRLLPGVGMVDLAARYHQSVYGSLGSGITDQLSALPSVHVAWAVLVAAAVVTVSRSRWRWLALAHPLVTAYVVVATANHFWLDGVAALAVVAAVYAVVHRTRPSLVP